MKITKLFQYVMFALLVLSLSQTVACKKKQSPQAETKNSQIKHKLLPGMRFDKRGLDLRKRRKIGFPSQFRGIKNGKVVIQKRNEPDTRPQNKPINLQKTSTVQSKKAASPQRAVSPAGKTKAQIQAKPSTSVKATPAAKK